jgi:hypothetical protein
VVDVKTGGAAVGMAAANWMDLQGRGSMGWQQGPRPYAPVLPVPAQHQPGEEGVLPQRRPLHRQQQLALKRRQQGCHPHTSDHNLVRSRLGKAQLSLSKAQCACASLHVARKAVAHRCARERGHTAAPCTRLVLPGHTERPSRPATSSQVESSTHASKSNVPPKDLPRQSRAEPSQAPFPPRLPRAHWACPPQ